MRPTPKELLSLAKTEAFLISDLTNIRYLSGVEMTHGYILASSRRFTLFADGRYIEVARKKARNGIAVKPIKGLEGDMKKYDRIGVESETMTLEELRKFKRKYKNTKFVQRTGVLQGFRRSKDPDEIRSFKKAQKITRQMISRIPKALRNGISEKKLALKLLEWAIELGADELSFDPIVAFGSHTSRPHHHPTDRKFKSGQLVQIDVGARYKGYCADQSAVFFTGKPTKKQQEVFNAVSEAFQEAKKSVKAGMSTCKLDEIARSVLKKHKLARYFVHSLGHGVGLDVHEGVSLSEKQPPKKLLKDEIVTIEPGVYIPGKFGMRIEEEVVVRE